MRKTDVVKPKDYDNWTQNIIPNMTIEKLQEIKAIFDKAWNAKKEYQARKIELLKEKYAKIKQLYKEAFKKDREAKEAKIKEQVALELAEIEKKLDFEEENLVSM